MSSANGKPARLVVSWSAQAQESLDQTMAHVYAQDMSAGNLMLQRLQKALDLIAEQPGIGTPTKQKNLRRFPIPRTGHTIEYRVGRRGITITRWVRQTRKP
ncbi:type II toxin-antitoxin system RelE/ParE family toxin [Duganella sp. BJB475]|uniref:type II toxin-antitoxin system RelE/ParE family toxin n=1 Tax=unclassified Duganella TaxID=2636909 RepID=UPI000E343904|nr:type II toxin-antitoxin system RelE/ParE family toxin [Duganella sp. BJB475]RFP27241.1 type II toxin-antitoxin system RelE/ParE family toxin [Duganella sp. BJB476]